jgi:hypothetical protein
LLCPVRKNSDGTPKDPSQPELNSIATDPDKLAEIRSRLSDISWWMRLLCQRIAQRANAEENQAGKFWQNRYRAVRLLDEEAILACAAYVDLNPIRAALAETLESSDHTSIRRRIQTMTSSVQSACFDRAEAGRRESSADGFLSPISIDELRDALGPQPSTNGVRCSDKGFLPMTTAAYVELLDWTSREVVCGKRGFTPEGVPAIFQRLKIRPPVWLELVKNFGTLFSIVAGQPHRIDGYRGRIRRTRFHMRASARRLLTA